MPLKFQEAIKDVRLRSLLHKYLVENKQEESYAFLAEKTDNRTLYTKYIGDQAERQINIPDHIRTPLDRQAEAGEWDAMNMSAARVAIVKMLDDDVMRRFTDSEEYQGYLRSQDTSPASKLAAALKLKGEKATRLAGLLKVYNDARTPTDKFLAYEAMAKLAGNEAKLRPALEANDQPVPLPVLKGDPAKALAYFTRVGRDIDEADKTAVTTALKKYNTATLRSARATVLAELTKLVKPHSLNPREMLQNMLYQGGWYKKPSDVGK
jgi:hypothetical protein